MNIVEQDYGAELTEPSKEVEFRRVIFGRFAGTEERVILVLNGELQALDTGGQGGGQN